MSKDLANKIRAANTALLVDGDVDAIGEYFTDDYVAHLTSSEMTGVRGVKTFLNRLRKAFPKLEVEIDVLVASKDRIAWQRTLTGKHAGEYVGFPATGRRMVWRDMATSVFRAGKIAEEWVISDLAEQLLRAKKR